jgi:hypothetical protein
MFKKYSIICALLFFSACSSNRPKEFDPPAVSYELTRVGDFVISNSPVFANVAFLIEGEQKFLGIKLILKNMNMQKDTQIDLAGSLIAYNKKTLPADCRFIDTGLKVKLIEKNLQTFVACKIIFTNDEINLLGKNDLIAELLLPLIGNNNVVVTKIHVRNERLNE